LQTNSKNLIAARAALLQGVQALGPHLDSVILVGAQAIYLHTSLLTLPVAPFTTDADLVFDPNSLGPDPDIDLAMRAAGFLPSSNTSAVGSWVNADDMPIDLMVPESYGGNGRRAAKLPGHAEKAVRKTPGLEAVLFDNSKMTLAPLVEAPGSKEALSLSVAGPTSLLIAKLIKFGERVNSTRFERKYAYDIYRILLGTDLDVLANTWNELSETNALVAEVKRAKGYLQEHFAASANGSGAVAAGQAE